MRPILDRLSRVVQSVQHDPEAWGRTLGHAPAKWGKVSDWCSSCGRHIEDHDIETMQCPGPDVSDQWFSSGTAGGEK